MSDQLIVRTMKDDIAEMNATPVVAPVSAVYKSKHKKPEAPVFSLPAQKPHSISEGANPQRKGMKNIFIGFGYILLFCVLVAGALYGYIKFGTRQIAQDFSSKNLTLFQAIPKEALAVVDYNLETEEKRVAVKQIWAEVGDDTQTGATSGSPTSLTSITDNPHVYYVVLPNNPKPFLLIKNTTGIQEYVAQQSSELSLEIGGWYVLHAENAKQYTEALSDGSIGEDSSLVTTSIGSNYLVRYGLSRVFASAQFPSVVASAVGLSRVDALVFHVTEHRGDGTLRASAQIAGNPPGEGVVENTAELISLIPGDISFARVGFNLSEDVSLLEDDTATFDTTVLMQPAVRQFISLFNTPYAIFERKGSDGVQDIGIIMQLPLSLRQKVKTGDSIIEQGLPSLIPLIIGKALGVQVAFTEAFYNTAPLRYVNLNGQSQTLDYSVGDNFLLISSSREGMYNLLDTSLGTKPNLSLEEPWKNLIAKADTITKDRSFSMGALSDPALRNTLPIPNTLQQVPIIVSSGRTSTGVDIQLVLLSK